MADVAKKIELVIKDSGPHSLLVDGEEFPWHILSDGVLLTSEVDGMPVAYVAILAEKIETRFENGSVDSKPVDSSDITVQGLTDGDTITLDRDVPWAPMKAWAFKHVGFNSDFRYLIRVGEGDLWTWATRVPESRGDTIGRVSGGFSWSELVGDYAGEQLEVLRVS